MEIDLGVYILYTTLVTGIFLLVTKKSLKNFNISKKILKIFLSVYLKISSRNRSLFLKFSALRNMNKDV